MTMSCLALGFGWSPESSVDAWQVNLPRRSKARLGRAWNLGGTEVPSD